MNKRKYLTFLAICSSLFLWLALMVIVKKDTNFTYRWIALGFHLFSFFPVFVLFFLDKFKKIEWEELFTKKELLPFFTILILTLVSRFIFLKSYPFVAVGDEVRDGGLDTWRIVTGDLKNIFSYGTYESHGLSAPLFNTIFFLIFKNSVLTYRVASAFISTLSIFCLYLLARFFHGRKLAFWSSLIMISLPLSLFYSRTESVVMISGFLTVAIILLLQIVSKSRRVIDFIFLGMWLGFSSGFHTSARAVVIWAFFWTLFICVERGKLWISISNFLLVVFFFVVGFGPRWWFTTPEIFFQKRSFDLSYSKTNKISVINIIKNLPKWGEKYEKSFMVWFYEPTQTHYPDHKPVFPHLLGILFLTGLIAPIFIDNQFLSMIAFFALVIPFSNSAITEAVNNDHRLLPLVPVGSVLVAFGFIFLEERLKHRKLRRVLPVFFFFYLCFIGVNFFLRQPANLNKSLVDYVQMHLIYFLQKNSNYYSGKVCVLTSPYVSTELDRAHYHEQYRYFLPNIEIKSLGNQNVKDDKAFVFNGKCPAEISLNNETQNTILSFSESLYKISCSGRSFFCPLNYSGEIKIHY